ncbi:uncharacterized protein LOC109200983 [Oreochromis niloticus]|uniref:uncharacterized protein LOC109200983 n=3 Tax=Oreochromis niloticus TaxID=8128 RepID=UPI000DF303A2|nr:uncharacterized protein LOC109200983 [Oreochromis niloticus]
MSHPLYNLYASGKQSSAQGRYGQPSMQAERDSHKASPHLGPGSSFSSSGVSSATPAKSGGTIPSRLTMPMSCRPEGSKTSMEEDIKRSKPVGSAESTSETAVNILMQFGLEKEDLEHPISYSEDQITPDNLPFTLEVTRNIPVLAQMQDYTATSPRVFPHTCSLCNKECNQMKDWVSHQNTSRHIENCKLLRKQYPEWNGEIASPLGRKPDMRVVPIPAAPAVIVTQSVAATGEVGVPAPAAIVTRSEEEIDEPRRERHRSQSRSLYRSRQNRRSRSHSDSSWYDRPSSSRYRSRSRCRERRSSPRRRDEKRSSPRRSWERRSSTERSSPRRKKSSSSKILAKKLLETSALQSLSKQSDLETVVKTLAPALLAQLVKMKSSPSTSSSSSSRSASPETTKGTPSTEKTKAGKSSSPTMVRLQGTEAAVAPKNTAKATEAIEPIKGAAVDDSVTAEKISKDQPVAVTHPTFWERIQEQLSPERIRCLKTVKLPNSKLVLLDYKVLLISNLPEYHDGCYAEEDIAGLLTRHRFEYYDDTIYVIPQARMAFALMPTAVAAKNIVLASEKHDFILNGSKLRLQVEKGNILMTPLEFYKSLMKRLCYQQVTDNGARIIYIRNISPGESRDLREALEKMDCVRNYLPLLNKVFIEFQSLRDADRLGVWYSLLKRATGHKLSRLKIPHGGCTSLPPRLPDKALPDSEVAVDGATVPTEDITVPQRSTSPYWITMTTSPFVFPTVSPWFTIPEYLTVSEPDDIEKAQSQGSTFSTIMLTGLPEGNYRQEDVTKLVWRYFPDQTVQTLYYNIIVLSLQRRAFVFFNSWDACCDFARDYLKNPVTVGEWTLRIHIVLQDMLPGSSEESMYRSMMKWSNTHVPESEALEDRLLSVEVSEVNVDLLMMIMEAVASIAAFVRFLPLANRICIEMAEPGGLTQVMESNVTKDYLSSWSKAGRIESLKSLKQRLQDSGENKVHLKMKTKKTAESTDAVTKGDCQAESQRTEEEAVTQPDAAAAPAGRQPEPKCPDDETQEGEEKDGWSMADIKVVGKRRRELVGPEAKRSRAQSPCVVADFRLPQFNPNSPIGQEFVVPKSGFFCNICSVFCLNEKTAKELHCCSQKHYDNLQKYYEERRQRATKTLSHTSPGSVSD